MTGPRPDQRLSTVRRAVKFRATDLPYPAQPPKVPADPVRNTESRSDTGENVTRTFAATARCGILRRIWPLAVAPFLLVGPSGCGGASETDIPQTTQSPTPAVTVKEVRSDRDRTASPQAAAGDLEELVRGNNAFALDLYSALKGGEGNLFYSPFSISQTLAMTLAGARGETERQMADTLHFQLPQSRLHPSFNALDRELASRSMDSRNEEDRYFQLNIANAIWGQHGYEFLPDFLDALAENYGAGLRSLDFAGAPEESRLMINDWVLEETGEKIEDLLPPGIIDGSTRLVLTNAIYFNASWSWPFPEKATQKRPFHLMGGGKVETPMMSETSKDFYGYARGNGYQAVDVPYGLGEMSMTILLPDEGTLREFEDSLDPDALDRIIDDIEIDYVTLTMPLFEFESEFSLSETLAGMGMPDAFGASADFSGMTGSRGLSVSAVVHKAFVSVDEKGTEAAAATSVVVLESGPTKDPIPVTVNQPFIFLIRDRDTGTVLFLGRVMNPEQ